MGFVIITDSASDVPKSVIERYHLHVIPTPVTIDGTDYFDGETIFPDDFYRIQQEEGHEIKTYHVNQFMFRKNFEPYAKNGDELLYMCFSTGIAGTFNAASLAKEELLEEYPDFKLTIIDTKCASIGYGLVVYKLLKMQENGAPKELIIEAGQYFCAHMKHTVFVKTLEYLQRGGRLTKTAAVVGSVLDIKPIIRVDEEGALVATERVRGWKKAMRRALEIVQSEGADLEHQTIGVCHGNVPEDFELTKQLIAETFHNPQILETRVGCAIGAHTGPGIVGIVYQDELNEKYEAYLRP